MTLQQKVKAIVGMGIYIPPPPPGADTFKLPAGFKMPPMDSEAARIPQKVPGAVGRTHPLATMGIPSITLSDGPAGIRINPIRNHDSSRTYYAKAFPVATLLASTWDTAVVKQMIPVSTALPQRYGRRAG
jgi:beta-glucosidase